MTYNGKHNEANGEHNRDGADDNKSWNCGVEGETDDPAINALRHRQVRNLLLTLLLADGVPMILAGDEAGRTQQGNNNAYCQDGPLSWTNWDVAPEWQDVTALVSAAIRERLANPLLSPDDFRYHDPVLDAAGRPTGRYRLAWMNGYSGEMGEADWADGGRRLLGMYTSDQTTACVAWYYSGTTPLSVTMPPPPWGTGYRVVLSSAEDGELPEAPLAPGEAFTMPPRTVVLMRVDVG